MMNSPFDGIVRFLLNQFWQVAVVYLLIRAVTMCRFFLAKPRLGYLLWSLVVIKALVPPLWSSPTGIFSWLQTTRTIDQPNNPTSNRSALGSNQGTIVIKSLPPSSEPPEPHARFDTRRCFYLTFVVCYFLGVAACAWHFIKGRLALCAIVRRSNLCTTDPVVSRLEVLLLRFGLKRKVRLLLTAEPVIPCTFGLIQPTILLSRRVLSEFSPPQIDAILAHELSHICHYDAAAGLLQLCAHVTHWFNPMVRWANRNGTRDREIRCDEEAVTITQCDRRFYVDTLHRVLNLKPPLSPLLALGTIDAATATDRRFSHILKQPDFFRWHKAWIPWLLLVVGVLVLVPGARLILKRGDLLFKDNFNSNWQDPTRWKDAVRPVVRFQDGHVQLIDRGYLVTAPGFADPISIDLDWKWLNLHGDPNYVDTLNVVLKTSGRHRPQHSFEARDGLIVNFNGQSGEVTVTRAGADNSPMPVLGSTLAELAPDKGASRRGMKERYAMAAEIWHRIRVEDDGKQLRIYLALGQGGINNKDLQTPILIVPYDGEFEAHQIAIYNREHLRGVSHESWVDNFVVRSLAQVKTTPKANRTTTRKLGHNDNTR